VEEVAVSRTLVVTNDFPPRPSRIGAFVRELAGLLPPEEVVVYAGSAPGDAAYDATVAFPVLRDPARRLLPTVKVTAGVVDALQAYGCDRVLFGSAAPLGLLAPALGEAGAERLVAMTHRHECWWVQVPGARRLLRRVGDTTDVLTYLSESTRSRLAPALSPPAAARMVQLGPGVDPAVFRPGSGGSDIRRRYRIPASDPVVVSVARLSGRAQEELVRSFAGVLASVPSAWLLVVGGGPDGPRLARLARSLGVAHRVVFTGEVSAAAVPAYLDAGNVFVRVSRARVGGVIPDLAGVEVLQAQACGLPVVVAAAGDADEAVRPGETGYVVGAGDPGSLVRPVTELLRDPTRAVAMGRAGRTWVERTRTWEHVSARLDTLLDR
jgi:phosphatidylinositol alpha-1,6-mannosyltransferase